MRGITRLAGPAPPLTIRQTCKMLMPMLAALAVSAALLPEQVVMSIGSNTPSAARVLEGSQNAHEIRVPVHSPTRPDEQVPLLASVPEALGLIASNGVGRLPALGWNSWNAYECDINEAKALSAAEHIVNLGLKDVGYQYVNIDDCWSIRGQEGRDIKTGRILPDTQKFPDGISGLANKIHDMGLKIGIYSDAGDWTCQGYPASLGYEKIDAQTFADWGIDYLKYDNCNVPSEWLDECVFCQELNATGGNCQGDNYCPSNYDWSKSKTAKRYNVMRNALLEVKRPILYSLCEWGSANVQTWGNDTAHSWRSTGDIEDKWESVLDILNRNSFTMNHVNFWGHSDADMLEIGNGGLSVAEERSHFAFWAVMKSPLLIGCDLAKIPSTSLDILKNKYLLAFHQDDTIGEPAQPYKWGTNPDWTFDSKHPPEFWSGRFKQGTIILVLNVEDTQYSKNINWAEVPELKAGGRYRVIDAWSDKDYGCFDSGVNVALSAHDTAVLVLKDDCSSRAGTTGNVARNFIA